MALSGEIYDYPTRMLVHSESVTGDSYLVDLTAYQVGEVFNGSCTCPSFKLTMERKLKQSENERIYRCKHIRWARENVLDYLLPVMKASDPNQDDLT